MTASADPAALIRFDISGVLGLKESCEEFCECEVNDDIFDIAESIDDVRGKDLLSGRIVALLILVEVDETGDCGGELSGGLLWGKGEEKLRN